MPVYKACVIIPVYNHEHAIAETLMAIIKHDIPCLLVNDGSNTACTNKLRELTQSSPDVHLLELEKNSGKGAAVILGMKQLGKLGYTHALQVDADGQHNPADIPAFLELSMEHPDAIINGIPVYDESVPRLREYARYLTHVWVWINTLSLDIKDSMCGFRLYPLATILPLVNSQYIGNRMDFDTEILVKSHWQAIPIIEIPTKVRYPSDGVSHFRAFRDNLRITWMHTRLFFGMLFHLPRIISNKLSKRHIQASNS